MSLLSLQFRSIAARLQVLEKPSADIRFPRVKQLLESHMGRELLRAIYNHHDMDDPFTYWDLLLIDVVLRLENRQGNVFRVAVYLVPNEFKAYKALRTIHQPAQFRVRQQLNIHY
ncbi:hypothetical protein [Synechococcus sp. BDU 130192]|uniref:hypothetical protein n=1 Tax=Synechococcus sp. BDU 130192 TaxID=2042059 RepID=UPI000C08B2A5|nr:hypothetical protein [Synechococcus sp. BDU 130192]